MIRLILANGASVEVSQEEVNEFITQGLIPNPDWRHSGLLTPMEWTRYLQGRSTHDELKKVAQYILIYIENLSFTAYLFDKSEGHPDQGKEFNMPIVKKLRELYQKVSDIGHQATDIFQDVHEMENLCMETGTDPL